MFGMQMGKMGGVGQMTLAQRIAYMFGSGEQGAWYDPSDLSTLFQDSAGATPVTAVEQPVGLMLDKSGRGNHAFQATSTKRPVYSRRVNLLLNTTTLSTQSIVTTAAGYKLVFSGTGSVTLSGTATGVYGAGTNSITCTAGTLTLTVSGSVQDASFHLAIDLYLPYQGVNTATDYDADPGKFPAYLKFDGIDDALQTNSIDFTGTDKMTVWAGVTKLSDAGMQIITELGASFGNVGSFALRGPTATAANNFGAPINTGAIKEALSGLASAPVSAVLSGVFDGAGDPSAYLRVGGVQTASGAGASGAAKFLNQSLHIGARAGSSFFFNGRLYGLIIRGAQSTQSQIEACELYVKQKMRLP